MALNGNYIDFLILIVVGFYVLEGVKRGFWALVGDLASFFGSIFIAFRAYPLGAKPLRVDSTIVPVARAHSRDMWERSYFSHTNPDGETSADRMARGGVKFLVAGENLALAPTVETAHEGLMNSPGHRRNILDPQFSRIGI